MTYIIEPLRKYNELSPLIIRDPEKLKTACEKFNFDDPPMDPIELSQALVVEMRDFGGIGLAANQIGFNWRVFAMRANPNIVCFNPRIVMPSEEQVYLEEGCLSFPGLLVKIRRPKHIRVRYQEPSGEMKTEMYTGMAARVFQHELDHLDGILFYERANRYHREKAFKKWQPSKLPQMNVNTSEAISKTIVSSDDQQATQVLPELIQT